MSCTSNLTFRGEFLSGNAEIDITHSEAGKYSSWNHVMRILVRAEGPFQTQNLNMWVLVGLFV